MLVAGLLTLQLLVATAGPQDPALARYYAEVSVPRAHGRNVVNAILVDFRGLDTLGEIAVLFVALAASLPLLALLRGRRAGQGGTP